MHEGAKKMNSYDLSLKFFNIIYENLEKMLFFFLKNEKIEK